MKELDRPRPQRSQVAARNRWALSSIKSVLGFMKAATDPLEMAPRTTEVETGLSTDHVFLVPLSAIHLEDPTFQPLMEEWNVALTHGDLMSYVNDEERIAFLLSDRGGRLFGLLAFQITDQCELELMWSACSKESLERHYSSCLQQVWLWAEEHLGIRHGRVAAGASPEKTLNGVEPDKGGVAHKVELADLRSAAERILTAGPSIGPFEKAFVAEAVREGWNDRHSDYLVEFEKEFAAYVGADYAMATSSCTGALHLALLALGIGPGDEVIVPETTWVATASAVAYTGATPVFADVDPVSWCMCPVSVEACIGPATRALIPVHLYGFAAPIRELIQLARQHGLEVVEDAAPAIGTLVGERAVGSFGAFGCFSFQGAKMLVTGEGGMLVTNDENLQARVRTIADHGRKSGTFWIQELGRKYRMSNLSAALGLGQLCVSERQIEQKRRIATWYEEELTEVPGLTFQAEMSGTRSIFWMNSIAISSDDIAAPELAEHLQGKGIDSRPVFPAISTYPFWENSGPPGPVADKLATSALNLPSGVRLSRASIAHVGQVIRDVFA